MQNRQRLPLKKGRENKSMLNLSIPGIFTLKGKKKTRGVTAMADLRVEVWPFVDKPLKALSSGHSSTDYNPGIVLSTPQYYNKHPTSTS